VLAVVDHEQLGTRGQERAAGGEHVAVHDLPVERGREHLGDGSSVGHRCQPERGGLLGADGDLGGQAGLADTTRAEDGDQPFVVKQAVERGEFGVASA
jgi:hypothetical protein